MTIGRKEIEDTMEFLSRMIDASGAEFGDKLSNWREGQFDVVEEDLREFIREYVTQQVIIESLSQIGERLSGEERTLEEMIVVALNRVTAIAITHGITLGLELHRRYCVA